MGKGTSFVCSDCGYVYTSLHGIGALGKKASGGNESGGRSIKAKGEKTDVLRCPKCGSCHIKRVEMMWD
jgi:predicted RNA-binding Zn-ribbon protein involved in translation (DUF1610 family)